MAKKNIKTNAHLRIEGWKKAAASPRTPSWLKKSIRKNIRDLSRRLKTKR